MKLLIAGSRGYEHYNIMALYSLFEDAARLLSFDVHDAVDREKLTIISGGARGIDSAGEAWAGYLSLSFEMYRAHWSEQGKRAGYIRNAEMAEACDAAVLIWDGTSKGTSHMRDLLVKAGKPFVLMFVPL